MFPSVKFGRYEQEEFERNQTFGIQTREEGLRITNELSRLTLPSERNIDYKMIAGLDNKDVKGDILQDEQSYIAIYQDFSHNLIDYI